VLKMNNIYNKFYYLCGCTLACGCPGQLPPLPPLNPALIILVLQWQWWWCEMRIKPGWVKEYVKVQADWDGNDWWKRRVFSLPNTPFEFLLCSILGLRTCECDARQTRFRKICEENEMAKSSFGTGIVSGILKIAKVVPIYKSGQREQSLNYRPI